MKEIDQSQILSLKYRYRVGEFVHISVQRRAQESLAATGDADGLPLLYQVTSVRIDVMERGFDVHYFVLPADAEGVGEHMMIPEVALELAPEND